MNERPVPQLKLLETERYHDRAIALLKAMFAEYEQNLIKHNHPVTQAAVLRSAWREAMQSNFSLGYGTAGEKMAKRIEEVLLALGEIELPSALFVKPALTQPDPEPVKRELTLMDKFFCQACKKIKGIPHNHRRYAEGQKVNFTQKGVRGVAINRVVSINSINGQQLMLDIGTKLLPQHISNVTPEWAPSPLIYSTMGQCWCDIDPAYLQGGGL